MAPMLFLDWAAKSSSSASMWMCPSCGFWSKQDTQHCFSCGIRLCRRCLWLHLPCRSRCPAAHHSVVQDNFRAQVTCLREALHDSLSKEVISLRSQVACLKEALREKPEKGLSTPICTTKGCVRPTWNGDTNEVCCRSCWGSYGRKHGPECEGRFEDHQRMAKKARKDDDAIVDSTSPTAPAQSSEVPHPFSGHGDSGHR